MRVLVLALLLASPAFAEQTWAAYEGPGAVQTGSGGTKITENGIDYWTTGTPPRRYQILGVLTDARKDRLADGKVLGSKSVARRALSVGGNAVIFGGSDAKSAGIVGGLSGGFAWGRQINRTTTQLLVVKYLE